MLLLAPFHLPSFELTMRSGFSNRAIHMIYKGIYKILQKQVSYTYIIRYAYFCTLKCRIHTYARQAKAPLTVFSALDDDSVDVRGNVYEALASSSVTGPGEEKGFGEQLINAGSTVVQ